MRAAVRFAAFVVPMLLVLYLAFQPPEQERAKDATPMVSAPDAAPPSSPPPASGLTGDPESTDIVVVWRVAQDGEVTGPRQVELRAGDPVILRVTSPSADEMHVHGYDLSQPLPAGAPAELRFAVTTTGRFEVELHHAHVTLGFLEVRPD